MEGWQSDAMSPAPTAPRRPHEITRHGDTRVDPYYWLMDRDSPEVIAHLEAENAYLVEALGELKPLEDELFETIKSHIEETDTSVPVRRGGWWHFERTREGLSYAISCRAPARAGEDPPAVDPSTTLPGEEVVLDENAEAEGHDFLSVGVLSISPDDRWVAVGVDFEGNERHTLNFRPLAGQPPLAETIADVYYGFAWASDSRHVFYTRVDDAMRPWQLWRHEVGTDPSGDALVYQEDDARYTVSVARSRDDDVILVFLGSSMTTEVRYIDAKDPTSELVLLEERRQGVEYSVEHLRDRDGRRWWLKVTNEDAADFRLLVRATDADEWREIIAERPGSRLDGVDGFAGFLAISERHDGCAAVRLVALADGDDPFTDLLARSSLVAGRAAPSTIAISANAEHETDIVRVVVTSLVTPRLVADVVVATGELLVRKQQIVSGGFVESDYATARLWVRASDGVKVPVSIVGRREHLRVDESGAAPVDGPRPLVLYGYGSYEVSIDPAFSSARLALLDRGALFAIAHVRGGGEMGRAWYESGKLAQKPTTFSDFVAVARDLVARGFTSPDRLAARGGSAGGLLMGAVMNLAPNLFRCVVAEVPFVDALTTMLDDSLPLTVGEWEEWGNPDASETAYRTMKAYSPYDNVRETNEDGTVRRYPDTYAVAGLNDSRVGFWEPTKWVLRLRDANPENFVVLKTEMGTGHGGPSGRYDAWRDEAGVLAFVVSRVTSTAG
jgi:oligopeptidase B